MLGLHALEQERESKQCPICGGPRELCENKDYSLAWELDPHRSGWCYRTKAMIDQMTQKTKGLPAEKAHVISAASVLAPTLNPAKIKEKHRGESDD